MGAALIPFIKRECVHELRVNTMIKKQTSWILIALVATGCGPVAPKDTTALRTAEFATDVVKRQDFVAYSYFDGKLVIPESAQATVFSPYDTSVLSVATGVGKHVDRGDQIIKLTIPGAETTAAAAKAYVNSAQANYAAQKADNSGPVREAERILAEARATEKAAREAIANGEAADLESATQARVAAEAALRQAQEDLRRSLQPTKETLRQASEALQMARADIAKGVVRAPISGTIVTLEAQPGMTTTAQQTLATIINYDAAHVQGLVPAALKDKVVKGARVMIAMTGPSSDPLDGTVKEVTVAPPSEGQTSQGYLAVIEFDNPRALTMPSPSVKRIGLKTGTVADALVVPVSAVHSVDNRSLVYVKNGDAWVETEIVTGLTDGALIEIKSGLKEGSVVRLDREPSEPGPV